MQGTGPNLLGRDWLQSIRLNWAEINCIRHASVDDVLQKHSKVFQEKLGRLKRVKAKIYVPKDATPRYFRPRTISYFLREKVDQELQRLQAEGIIEPVQFADWAAPIVPILKSDGHNVHICGDYKVTINKVAKLDGYPLPRIDNIFSRLSGGTVFSKLNLTLAYQQIELDDQHTKRTIPVHSVTIWYIFGSGHFSTNHGKLASECAKRISLSGRHHGHRQGLPRSPPHPQ